MGFNATVVVMNDALGDIREDPEFGRKLADAVARQFMRAGPVDVPARGFVNAATVIEQHHADGIVVVAVGGNTGRCLSGVGNWRDDDVTVLRNIAERNGYTLRRKPKSPRSSGTGKRKGGTR